MMTASSVVRRKLTLGELISEEAKSWIGRSAEPLYVEISRRDIVKYSIATEQQQEKYLRGDEAPPMFMFGALRPLVPMEELGPDGIPPDSFLPDLPLIFFPFFFFFFFISSWYSLDAMCIFHSLIGGTEHSKHLE